MRKARIWGTYSVCLLMFGCAGPIPELWPPDQTAPARTIVVSVDTWHAMIALPRTKDAAEIDRSQPGYEEWGFAEEAWYLEGRQGISGIFRALFWPSQGVVEKGHHKQVWSERTPQPPAERFAFRLSEEGFQRLRRYLESSIRDLAPIRTVGNSGFFPATRSYHVFHQCHQYSAHALREAGLPVSVFWAFSRGSFARQLRRAEEIEAAAEEISHPATPLSQGQAATSSHIGAGEGN